MKIMKIEKLENLMNEDVKTFLKSYITWLRKEISEKFVKSGILNSLNPMAVKINSKLQKINA